jgi:hypothetical protein
MFATTSITPAPAAATGMPPPTPRSRPGRSTAAAARTAASSPMRPAATGHTAPDCPAFLMSRKNRPNETPDAVP